MTKTTNLVLHAHKLACGHDAGEAREYNVAFLDLGTRTGIVHARAAMSDADGSWSLGIRYVMGLSFRDKTPGGVFDRCWSDLINHFCGVDVMVYEDVIRWSSSAAAKRYCGLLAMLLRYCHITEATSVPVPIRSAKIALTGDGAASKDEVARCLRADQRHLVWTGHDRGDITEDETDALSLAYLYQKVINEGRR